MQSTHDTIRQLLTDANHIVVIQADNPDADSLGSALALEHLLGDAGKEVSLYCGVTMPEYLRYLPGWDRVSPDMPTQFDASIIVDASTYTLLEKLAGSQAMAWVKARPCIVLDHHATVDRPLEFAAASIIDTSVASTGELIFHLSSTLGWIVTAQAALCLMASILGDTGGLTNELTRAGTYRVMAELTERGADRPSLEEQRREYTRMSQKVYGYKGHLIAGTCFIDDGSIAWVHVPQVEINEFSPLYNPAALIQADMLQVQGVRLAIVFKTYSDGKVTAALRANHGYGVCGQLAQHMGGGGHDYAAGFKVTDDRPFSEIKDECLRFAAKLLVS